MNYESTLRTLLEDAAPALRRSFEEALIARLLDGQRSVLFDLMRKAYDLGYRQALATQPSTLTSPDTTGRDGTASYGAGVSTAEPGGPGIGGTGLDGSGGDISAAEDDDDFEPESPGADLFRIREADETLGDDDGDEDAEAAPPPEEEVKSDINWELLSESGTDTAASRLAGERRPPNLKVRTSLTIGGLRDRVVKVFGLERFDIDIVVCRKGDRTRRQLKSTVRLSKYLAVGPV